MNKQTFRMIENLKRLSISETDAYALRRIAMTLHRWSERECNGEVERDETTGKTCAVFGMYSMSGRITRSKCPDLETGALKRLASIMANYPLLGVYVQGDPRGAPLYIYELERLRVHRTDIDGCYSSIGMAVHS
jgi:hypothetical protein